MIKISVIIPVYNAEEYLEFLLESLVNQTILVKGEELQILCINDASTDKSLEILKKYESNYPNLIQVESFEINQERAKARNFGLSLAKGEYIHFLDADDMIVLNAYEILYQIAIKNKSSLAVLFSYQKISLDTKSSFLFSKEYETSLYEKNILETKDSLKMISTLWGGIFKRSLVENQELRVVENIYPEDHATFLFLLIKLILNYQDFSFIKITSPLYLYRLPESNISVTGNSYLSGEKKIGYSLINKMAEELIKESKSSFDFDELMQFYTINSFNVLKDKYIQKVCWKVFPYYAKEMKTLSYTFVSRYLKKAKEKKEIGRKKIIELYLWAYGGVPFAFIYRIFSPIFK